MADSSASHVTTTAIVRRSLRSGFLFFEVLVAYLVYLALRRIRGREVTAALLERVHERSARRLRSGFEHLEGVYIKVGQIISMMTGFLPDVYLTELESLQDAVPARPFPPIRERVEQELGAPISALYVNFDQTPVASASLGQVHLAELGDGDEVAVKVQYPGIERVVDADLWMIGVVLRVLTWFLPGLNGARLHGEISDVIRGELRYCDEGRNAERIAANFTDDPHVQFPAIVWNHTTDRVLTMERCRGHKITDVGAIVADDIDPVDVIRTLVQAYFKQLLIDGVFHADPHPGNFFVSHDDSGVVITFLDFGAVAQLSDVTRDGMRTVVWGYMTQDNAKVIEGMRSMGFAAAGGDEQVFETAVRHYLDKLLHMNITDYSQIDLAEFDVWDNLEEMQLSFREITRAFEVPRTWFHVERTLALLLGLCARLDPTVDAFRFGFPYAVEFVFGGDTNLAALWGTVSEPKAPSDMPRAGDAGDAGKPMEAS